MRKKIKYLYCNFIASFYLEMRDFHNNYLKNPITATHYHLRMQKWREKGGEWK